MLHVEHPIRCAAYRITHLATGIFYIGSSGNIRRRLTYHKNRLKNKAHHATKLQEVFSNINELKIELYPTDDREAAFDLEQKMLDRSIGDPLCANVLLDAKSRKGTTHLPETRKKIGQSQIGKIISNEQREQISAALKGRKLPPEQVRNQALTRMNRPRTANEQKVLDEMWERSKKKIVADGMIFNSVTEAANHFGVSPATMTWRLSSNSPRFIDWKYLPNE